MVVYLRMDIGTAKPSLEERARVPHHLIDVLEPGSNFSVAQWVNLALAMSGSGLGWTSNGNDVSTALTPLVALATAGNVDGLIEQLNLLLYAGRMSAALKQELLDAITSVNGSTAASQLNRARVALFLALASPEYLVQR